MIDTIETLFGAFANTAILRSELRRLFAWLKERGVTAVITGERGDGTLTRHGIEEYVSDCVIVLDHRVTEQTSTRRLRILKYRGSLHGTNEYPFLIGESGVSVLPITSLGLQHGVSTERVSTGVPRLDAMLGDGGFYKGSTVLVNGTAGTGKSTLAAQFCDATVPARRARDVLRLRGVRGRDRPQHGLGRHRPAALGRRRPAAVPLLPPQPARPRGAPVRDAEARRASSIPRSSSRTRSPTCCAIGTGADVSAMLTRQVDFLKAEGSTALFTSLTPSAAPTRPTSSIASLVDTWLLVKTMEGNGELNRVLYVLKSRGTAHSNQIREFLLTDQRHRAGRRLRRARRACSPAPPARPRRRRSAPTAPRGSRSSSSAASTWSAGARPSRRRPRRSGASSRTRPTTSERLLSHGSTGAEDRAGQRAEQGRLRGADADEQPGRRSRPESRHERRSTTTSSTTSIAGRDFWYLRLYVAGQSPKSLRAFANLKALCEEHLAGRYEIEIVDLVEHPALARSDDILAIPTLVRRLPAPLRKIIGDLSNTERVLVGLRLRAGATSDDRA